MNNPDTGNAVPLSAASARGNVLGALNAETKGAASEDPDQQRIDLKDVMMGKGRPSRGRVSYRVYVTDTVGTALLGGLVAFLLIALLAAHRRERKL